MKYLNPVLILILAVTRMLSLIHAAPCLRPRTHGGENLPNNLFFWQIIPFWNANLRASGAFFAHVYGALQDARPTLSQISRLKIRRSYTQSSSISGF